jgi:hypothetical protein
MAVGFKAVLNLACLIGSARARMDVSHDLPWLCRRGSPFSSRPFRKRNVEPQTIKGHDSGIVVLYAGYKAVSASQTIIDGREAVWMPPCSPRDL